jgi:hypothetical protein
VAGARNPEGTSVFDVLARWGYSEIVSGTQAARYAGPDIDVLREKQRKGVAFETLTASERYPLALQCSLIRSALLVYLTGVERFTLDTVTRYQLGHVLVPPNVWYPQSANGVVPFSQYIDTHTDEPRDARRVPEPANGYVAPNDPLTFGYANGYYVLLDGYHRAATLWRYGPPDAEISTYKPEMVAGLPPVGRPFLADDHDA